MTNRRHRRLLLTQAAVYGHGWQQPLRAGERLTVQPWQRAVILRDGEVVAELGPGSSRRWQRRSEVRLVDVRPRLLEVPTQEVPTSDGVPIKVSAVARYAVVDAVAHVTASASPEAELYLAVQIALREVLSTTSVDELLEGRAEMPTNLLGAVRVADELGVAVEHVEIKDLVLPAELRRARAQVLVAHAEAQCDLERARGETAALRALANAARLASEQPALLQLRLLQELGATGGNTVVLGADAVGVPRPQ